MIILYFLALNVFKTEKQQKTLIVVMSAIVLLMSVRSFRSFSAGGAFRYDKRVGGPFEAVGLGPNHFGAFIVVTGAVFLGLLLVDKEFRRKLLYGGTILFSLHPLLYSYSRGAYVAAAGAIAFFGVMKQRSLLVLILISLLTWQTLLPVSVVDRIMMTETEEGTLEGSAARRLDLWDHAISLFQEHPMFGVGFGGFGFTVPEGQLTDTHNFYMKTLAEQGVIGIALLALLLMKAFHSGWRLYKTGKNPFHQGLGFGFMGAVIACMITNVFGDRWSYFALGGYFWVFWGLVDRGLLLSQQVVESQKVEQGL
jgi:O-antigen ligase